MCLRPCCRKKNGKRHAYCALVESYRTERGPRQRVVAYLGEMDEQGRLGVKHAAEGRAWRQTRLFEDTEPRWVEGEAKANPKAKRGYSRDRRPDTKQVTIALVVTRCGMSLAYEVFCGNRSDVMTVEEIVKTMESRYGKADRIWVMDRGMVSEANVKFLRDAGRKCILGTPKSKLREFGREITEGDWETIREGIEAQLVPAPGGDLEGQAVPGEMFVLCRSSDRREKEKAMHDRFEKRIEEGLRTIETSCRKRKHDPLAIAERVGRLMGRNTRAAGLFRYEIKGDKDKGARFGWSKVGEWRDWARLSEGCYLLRSNVTDWTPEDLWKAYTQLTDAEAAFRIHKSHLGLRPIWHQKEDRVEAHVLVCFLA